MKDAYFCETSNKTENTKNSDNYFWVRGCKFLYQGNRIVILELEPLGPFFS